MRLATLFGFTLAPLGVVLSLAMILGCEPPAPHAPFAPVPQHDPHRCEPPKVVAFCAPWCGPCQQAQPTLAWLETKGVQVVHVNIDEQPELARQYGVTSVPTFFVYVCGKPTVRTQDVHEVVRCMTWLKDDAHGATQTKTVPQLPR